jgi:hypothetical protein
MLSIGPGEDDGNELLVPTACFVKRLRDDRAFPLRTEALAGRLPAANAACVRFRADNQDKAGGLDLATHPCRPSFRRRHFVLIDVAIDPLCAKAVRELEYAFEVGR